MQEWLILFNKQIGKTRLYRRILFNGNWYLDIMVHIKLTVHCTVVIVSVQILSFLFENIQNMPGVAKLGWKY